MNNIFFENGYTDIDDYIKCLSEDYDLTVEAVRSIVEAFPDDELFDGVIIAIETLSERAAFG